MYNQQLHTLLCVIECGSFSKAAEQLFISPTAVMKQINSLEKHLGLQLVDRTSSGVVLTDAGACVCRYARQMIQLSRRAIQEANEITKHKERVIRVGASLLKPCHYLTDIWRTMSSENPQFLLEIVPFMDSDINSSDSIMRFFDEKIDLLVSPNDRPVWLGAFRFLPLGFFDLCCAVPRHHPLAAKEILRLEDLHGEFLFMLPRGNSTVIDCVRDDLITYHPQIHILDTEPYYDIKSFNQCVRENCLLITLAPWRDIHPSLMTIPIDWKYQMPYGIVYRGNPPRHILEFLRLLH